MAKMKAYAVTEEDECTGGIIYAEHNVVARRIGANEYANGEFSMVTCRRAKWADEYAKTEIVPASEMVWQGWRFECAGCGRTIEADMEDEAYENWTPDHVIGHQHGLVFCNQQHKDWHDENERHRRYVQGRAIGRFMRFILRRFPGARFVDENGKYRGGQHAYASKGRNGKWGVRQVYVPFNLPDFPAKYGPISLDYNEGKKPYFTCAGGDKEALEAYCRDRKIKVN